MRKLGVLLIVSIAAATLITVAAGAASYERRLQRVAVQEALPQLAGRLAHEPAAVTAVFLHYAGEPALVLNARLALLRYPAKTRQVLSLYGLDPSFQEILGTYGANVIPPIAYFRHHAIGTLKVMKFFEAIAGTITQIWQDDDPAASEPAPTEGGATLLATERGRYAIAFIQQEGHDFLGQFVVDAAGEVHWIQSERVLEGINAFFAGGIRALETQYRKGEELAATDYLWAGVDVLAPLAALKALRIVRAGVATAGIRVKAAAVAGRGARASRPAVRLRRTAVRVPNRVRAGGLGGWLVKYSAAAATAYLVVQYPGLITGLAGEIARFMGLPAWTVQLAAWSVILLPALYLGVFLLRLALRPLQLLVKGLAACLAWLDRRGERSAGWAR